MAAQYQFVMRAGPTIGKVYPLEGPELTIGRESTNSIAINDVEVSRKHARMEMRGPAYVIQDLGSTNGTFVNGQRVTGVQVLNPGDSISLGEGIVLSYESAFDPNATMMSANVNRPAPESAVTTMPAPEPAAPMPYTPPPEPAPYTPPAPAPAPVYAGQVPSTPAPAAPASAKRRFPVWVIILVLALVVICGCIAFFVIIDQLNLWCRVVPFLVPLLGGTCA
jgi:predicted component of type VI protein secretion system